MSNNDKFIRDTEFGKLMESKGAGFCLKCKYFHVLNCEEKTNDICFDNLRYYFAKDEPNETKKV